jgi:hypothetical protein
MPLEYDVEIDGDGYMVAPGSYRRTSDGWPEGRLGRVVITDFVGGQHRALQLETDRGWDSAGVGPAMFGQGVEPWPFSSTHTDPNIVTVSAAVRAYSIAVGDKIYLAIGRFLYRSPALTALAWGSFVQVGDVGAGKTIERLSYYRGDIILSCGSGLEAKRFNPSTLALTAFGGGGIFAGPAVGYANQLAYADPTAGNEAILRISTGTGPDARELDAAIVNVTTHGGKIAIATRASLYKLGGRADPATSKWIGEPEPIFSAGSTDLDDFVFLVSFGGRLYTWLAGEVVEWNPNAGSNRQGWKSTGIDGIACFGATVAGNMLIVCLSSRLDQPQIWAFDGTGWWLITQGSAGSTCRIWPVALAGAGAMDLIVFTDGNAAVTYALFRLVYRDAANNNYGAAGSYTTSMLDAGERDKPKAWRKIGAVFAAPQIRGNNASVDPVTVTLSYSINGGGTFVTAAAMTLPDPQTRAFTLDAGIASGASSSGFIQLRVSWSGVIDWAPTLVGLWAEYELLDSPARRRKWLFNVHARDNALQRDGSVSPQTGRQLAAGLWDIWENGITIPFKDIDFDDTGTTHQVRVVAIEEAIPKPSDSGRWGASTLSLTLVEV